MDENEFLRQQFEHERCANCGGDADDHTVGYGPFGEPHAVCNSNL